MSSILKALRKLVEEKAALGEGGVDLSRDILKHSSRKQHNNNFWPILSAVLFLLLVGFGIFLWSGNSAPPVASHQIPETAVPVGAKSQTGDSGSLKSDITPAENSTTPPTLAAEVPRSEEIVIPVNVHAEPEATQPNGMPYLKLTGIAYRENAAERIAIINDLPVMMGTVIEGAQLVEILPDGVVLNWKGTVFPLRIEDEN